MPVPVATTRFHEPAAVCEYAGSGYGKTTDLGYSFPCALFLAAPGALKPVLSTCGYDPYKTGQVRIIGGETNQIRTIEDATGVLRAEAKRGVYDAVAVDDFSFLAEQTFALLEKKLTGFKLWGALREQTLDFRNVARSCGMHVLVNCWEQAPTVKKGNLVRGGPKLPSDLPEAMPAMFDLVLRGGRNEARKPWPGTYRCYRADSEWITKDRHGVAGVEGPMNTAELLRAAGYDVKRHPGLPWQEEWVTKVADRLWAVDPTAPDTVAQQAGIGQAVVEILSERGYKHPHIVWTLRDAFDRVAIWRARPTIAQAFGWAAAPM